MARVIRSRRDETNGKENKQFFRTVAGKSLLFLTINILMIAVLACACAAVACYQEDLYSISEEEFYSNKSEDRIRYEVISSTENLLGIDHFSVENLSLKVTDEDGNYIASTRDFDEAKASAGKAGKYENVRLYTYDVDIVCAPDGSFRHMNAYLTEPDDVVTHATIEAYADPDLFIGYTDFDKQVIHFCVSIRYAVYPIAFLCVVAGIAAFIALMCVAGKRPGTEEVFGGPLDKVPFDVLAFVSLFITMPMFLIVETANGMFEAALFVTAFFAFANIMMGLCVSFASRVKRHVLIKGTLVYKIIYWTIKGILSIPSYGARFLSWQV